MQPSSHILNVASTGTPPEPNENLSPPFYLLLKRIWENVQIFVLAFLIGFLFWWVGSALSCLTFPFLLIALLVLRFLQLIKRGEDYDKVTRVKMIVEWYMFINSYLLVLAIITFFTYSFKFSSLKRSKIMGKSLFFWGKLMYKKFLVIFVARFLLFYIIQRYMPRMILEHNESGLRVVQAACDIVDCVLFWYCASVIMNSIPPLKTLGLPTRKWVEVPIFIVMGWNFIVLLTHSAVCLIHKLVSRYLNQIHDHGERSHRYLVLERFVSVHWLVYYINGMKRSFNFMLSSLLLLVVWVLCFGSRLTDTDSKAKTIRHFGTWTGTVLFILSFFWVLKDFVLLSWEANAVYDRLSFKILEVRRSLYFLGVLGRHSHDILKLRYEVVKKNGQSNGKGSLRNRTQSFIAKNLARVDAYHQDKRDEDDNDEMEETSSQLQPKLSYKNKARVRHDLLVLKNDTMTLFNIQQVAQYFLAAANAFLKETYTSDILSKLNSSDDNREILEKLITGKNDVSDVVQSSTESLLPKDYEDFEQLLKLSSSNNLSHSSTLKTWLEDSHSKCLFLANTLCSAKEIVDCLNNIIIVLLICASFILWLIVTGLADIKVLVLIASPLLAATFVFGDTCKSLFQGIIFLFVVHPFDVGDICVIDEKLMEVKSIGVWKTIFSNMDKSGTHEEIIYPNSELALKTLINHKTEIDWNDSVQFDIEHLGKQQIKELRKQIEDLLDEDHKDELMPGSHTVAMLSTGKEVKIAVRFKHDKGNVAITCFKCAKKDKLRSALIRAVQKLENEDKEGEN